MIDHQIYQVFVNVPLLYRGLADTMPWRRAKFYVMEKHRRFRPYDDYPILKYMVAMISPYVEMQSFTIIGTYIEDEPGWREGKGCIVSVGDCSIHLDVDGVITTKSLNSGDVFVFNGCARYCITARSERPITICFVSNVKQCDPDELVVVRKGVGKKRKITYETRTALAALSAGNIICGLKVPGHR
jgi:hypothetical protein